MLIQFTRVDRILAVEERWPDGKVTWECWAHYADQQTEIEHHLGQCDGPDDFARRIRMVCDISTRAGHPIIGAHLCQNFDQCSHKVRVLPMREDGEPRKLIAKLWRAWSDIDPVELPDVLNLLEPEQRHVAEALFGPIPAIA
jgi:hypothetical protein